MRSAITFSLVALAGSTLAAPQNFGNHFNNVHQNINQNNQKNVHKNVHLIVETVVHTVYQTEGGLPAPTPVPEQYYEAPPVIYTPVYEAPRPTPTPVYNAPVYEPAPAPAPAPVPAEPVVVGTGYQGVVDTWRSKMGLKPLKNSQKLQDNALNTVRASNGQMIHKLNDQSFGQVLAPGKEDNFEYVFVGGWLCEIPTLAGLNGICTTQSDGWTYMGQTGHAELLTSADYSSIGCAFHAGIWCCDLA